MENVKNTEHSLSAFFRHFDNAGIVGPISEKAVKNLELKRNNKINRMQRIHYFAIGHAFKQIDVKTIFQFEFNENEKDEVPTKFLNLQSDNFLFEEKLYYLVRNIRNLNSHYAHTFDKLEVEERIDNSILDFLKESFELAVLQMHIKEKGALPNDDYELTSFLKRMFFQKKKNSDNDDNERKEKNKKWNLYVDSLKSKQEVIDAVLFIKINSEFFWEINNEVEVLKIKAGTYLSFDACLFLISMFLYKNEANSLISKIQGYKRSNNDKMRSKRELISFFAKKFSSQDVDSNETHLVKFRDIIHYLNHYPITWNKDLKLETENKNPKMTKVLIDRIVTMEIYRTYPDYADKADFGEFVKKYLFSNSNKIQKNYVMNKLSDTEREYYEEITQDPHIKIFKEDIENAVKPIRYNSRENAFKIFIKQYVLKTFFPNKRGYERFAEHKYKFNRKTEKTEDVEKDFWSKLFINPKTETLKKRIIQNSLIESYGRNQDRFMNFAMRFLAEKNYFGKSVKFNSYQFYNNLEQEAFIEELKANKLNIDHAELKKKIDKLKYHNGKLVHFTTYNNHLENYPEWDMPFVNQNNAISIKISIGKVEKKIPIQRSLMVYFLEDALYSKNPDGKGLILNYYHDSYLKDFIKSNNTLVTNKKITVEEKRDFKKLLPRRLLNQYLPAIQNNLPDKTVLEKLLIEAEKKENNYNKLIEKTKNIEFKINQAYTDEKSTLLDDLKKRNKGKRFKLQFIRKACHLMYFKGTYEAQVADGKHHKRFHITKNEFNDFCKWMYAFEGEDNYKRYLNELFERKGFYLDANFKKLFERSSSIDNMFYKVKEAYKTWLESSDAKKERKNNYKIDSDKNLFIINTNMFYINVSHFIKFLESTNKITRDVKNRIIYNSLENETYLIKEYYYKKQLDKSEYKECGKLYNKLKSNKLEDALLFEIALNYMVNKDVISKNNVDNMLLQNLIFNIKNRIEVGSYQITVPFNKLDNYVEFVTQKKAQEDSVYNTSFLGDLQAYLKLNQIKGKIGGKTVLIGDLQFADLNTINNHVIKEALNFAKMLMAIEEYFIQKDNMQIKEGHYNIDSKDIPSLQNIAKQWKIWSDITKEDEKPEIDFRNQVYHFSLPLEKKLMQILKEVEKQFIKTEIPNTISSFQQLTQAQKNTCKVFMSILHNAICYPYRAKNDKTDKYANAKNIYFNRIIRTNKNG
ncbi:hypothetical protein [Lacinutrix chionoecetis]